MVIKIDPETGLRERTVDIANISRVSNIAAWGKPKGKNMFKRVSPLVDYAEDQIKQ